MDLNIRNVPEELMYLLKVEAAKSRETLRECCMRLLGGGVDFSAGPDKKPEAVLSIAEAAPGKRGEQR